MNGRLLGRYQVFELVGKGKMSSVYRGYDDDLKRDVAIKMLSDGLVSDTPEDEQENFALSIIRDGQFLAQLEHPNIVPVYDFGVADDKPYIVMRLLTGGSLLHQKDDPDLPDLNRAVTILFQVAGALDYAHSLGIIHQDIRPDNVLFDNSGNVYLTDFGLARHLKRSSIASIDSEVTGALAYLAPEQLSEQPKDYRVDLYALALTLYEFVTGKYPFTRKNIAQLMHCIQHDAPPSVTKFRPDLPKSLDAVFQRGLHKNPDERYASARAFAEALQEAVRHSGQIRLRIFVSYSAQNRAILEGLITCLESLGHVVWVDQELQDKGGQAWWAAIVEQIRECELFVFALTPDSLASYPCRMEYTYAHTLNKRILPVMLSKFDAGVLPSPLAAVQFVDYTLPDGFLTVQRSIANLPVPKSMPDPLPEPPPVPVTELNKLAAQIDGALDDEDTQLLLVAKLEKYLDDAKNREGALFLLQRLREKSGLFAAVDRKIGRLLSE